MNKSVWIAAAGMAALVLMALPGRSGSAQEQQGAAPAIVKVQRLQMQGPDRIEVLEDDGPSWLGVEAREVTPENGKEWKLPAERGVVVGRVSPESPASKAGLKETDVITEVDGQRVEGSAQFRRMIREIPAGRTVQLTVWRDGRAQNLSAKLDQAEELHRVLSGTLPGSFAFQMPDVEVPEMPELHEAPEGPDGPIVALGDGGELVIPS